MLQVLFSRAEIYHFFNVPDSVGLPLLFKRGTIVYDVRSPWAAVLKETFGSSPLVWLARLIERYMTRKADHVVCVNRMLARRAVEWGAQSVLVIPNYPAEAFGPRKPREETRGELGLTDSQVVLYLGKLSKVEGIEVLMRTIKEVVKGSVDVKFLIVGAGPQEEQFRTFLFEEGIEDRAVLTGWVPHQDVADYIQAADLCILPRPWDSVSPYIGPESVWKAGEYLVLGKPVVAPRMGGFAEAGFPVIAVDPSEMYRAVLDFFDSPPDLAETEHPRWSESHRRLRLFYEEMGAL
jgi:glycosyltransferase involved in cell wall biosynthesis